MIQANPSHSTDSLLLATLRGHPIHAISATDGRWRIFRSEDQSLSTQDYSSAQAASDAYWGDEFWGLEFGPADVEIAEAA